MEFGEPTYRYQIWVADLNSLYNETPNPPVMEGMRINLWAAQAFARTLHSHDTAVWIVDTMDDDAIIHVSA